MNNPAPSALPAYSPARYYAPGELIARRYSVIRSLGRGAAGTVYLCREVLKPDDLKAIKILATDLGQHPNLLARFYREGKVARSIESPYVVRSYDLIMDDGIFAYSMEYIPGVNLALVIHQSSELATSFIIQSLNEMTQGLCAIHKKGLIHRDLKPHNILVTEENHCKITDFGVVRLAREIDLESGGKSLLDRIGALWKKAMSTENEGLTGEGEIIGTVNYVSPEYVDSNLLDERSDIYSIGVIAFQMLVGKVPFEQGNMLERLEARVKKNAPNLVHLKPDAPRKLCDIIMSCLERKPKNRPQTAEELAELLGKIAI